MRDEIFFPMTFINHVVLNRKISDLDGQDLIQEVVVVSAEIGYLGLVTLDHLEDSVEKARMLTLPGAGFFQLPAVDDVAVEDEVFATVLFEKPCNLLGL